MTVQRIKAGDQNRCAPKTGEIICVLTRRLDGSRVHKHFKPDEIRLARRKEKDFQSEAGAPSKIAASPKHLTYEEFAERWRLARKDKEPESVQYALKRTYKYMGGEPLESITKLRLTELQTALFDHPYKRNTVEVSMHYAKAVVRTAFEEGLMPNMRLDPTHRLFLPARETNDTDGVVGPDDVPTVEESVAIYRATPPRWRYATALGFGCGMRIGEVLGVTPLQCLFPEHKLRIDEQEQRRGRVPPKTRRSVRTIKLPDWVELELLRAVGGTKHSPTMPLSTGTRGGVPRRDEFYAQAWRPALKGAGLDPNGYTFHGCRHFCASDMLARGYPATYVASYLGDTVETINRTYAHWLRGDEPNLPEDTRFRSPQHPEIEPGDDSENGR